MYIYIGKRVADEVGSGLITTQVIIDYLRSKEASPAKKKPRHDHDAVAAPAVPGPFASMVAAAAAAAVAAAAAAAASDTAAALAVVSARKRK